MHFNTVLLSGFCAVANAAHLSLKSGSLDKISCGNHCLSGLSCSQDAISSFSSCIKESCDIDDTTVAHTIEKFMSTCHSLGDHDSGAEALGELKTLYISAQMTIMKRAAESLAANGTTNGNSSNSSNSSSNSTSATSTGTTASTTQKGVYASDCTSLGQVLDGSCIVRSSDAGHTTRNSVLTFLGAALLAAIML